MKTKNPISIFIDIAIVFLFIYFLIFPNYASDPTRDALLFCGKTLVPSLFIYMILAKTIVSSAFIEKFAQKFGYLPLLLFLGSFCGAPIGAKIATDLYKDGRIDKKHAEYLSSFSNNASVSFVIGFVGSELFGDIKIGVRLFLFQLFSSASTAVIMKFVMFGKNTLQKQQPCKTRKASLSESISESAATMINLCACVVFFMVVGNAITNLVPLSDSCDAILKSFLEFSSGCASANDEGPYALPITAFSLGFTGCSVAMQVRSVSEGRLSMKPYFAGKALNCTIMTVLTIICS